MDRTIQRRVAALENLMANAERAQDPDNHPMKELSPEERDLLLRDQEARQRGEFPEHTPELVAAWRHYSAILRRRLGAGSQPIVAILQAGRTRARASRI